MAVLVMGAGDGLGGAVARRFAREGFHTCVVRRHADKLGALCDRITKDGGTCTPFGVDARNEGEVEALFEKVESEIGPHTEEPFGVFGQIEMTCCLRSVGDLRLRATLS